MLGGLSNALTFVLNFHWKALFCPTLVLKHAERTRTRARSAYRPMADPRLARWMEEGEGGIRRTDLVGENRWWSRATDTFAPPSSVAPSLTVSVRGDNSS